MSLWQSIVCTIVLLESVYMSDAGQTKLSIEKENFLINNKMTYSSATNNNVHGLLLNSRMIQAIFDDANSSTVKNWYYPDTNKWDPMRNTHEFISNLSIYKSHGLLSFTVGLQGGMPILHTEGNQPWIVSAYNYKTGDLNEAFFDRLGLILSECDRLSMIPILQFFYWGQAARFNKNNSAIYNAINGVLDWLISLKYNNILIDVANECVNSYPGLIINCDYNMSTITIPYMKEYIATHDINHENNIYIGSSLQTNNIPSEQMVNVSDIILLHGNGASPQDITNMINKVREINTFKINPKPIIFNEDPDFNFNSTSNNMKAAIDGHASWGYYNQGNNDYDHGYQSPPTDWAINTNKKAAFFEAVQSYTM